MSVSPNVFQLLYALKETTFADSAGDFSTGIKLKPTEKMNLENINMVVSENPTIRDDWDDAGSPPNATFREAKGEISTLISGATRSSNIVQEDALSKWLEWIIGSVQRGSANASVDDSAGTSTTTVIYHDSGATFLSDQLIMINGQVRRIETVGGADHFTIDLPLTSIPSDGTTIYTGEQFERTTSMNYVGVGVQAEDTELSFLLKGGVAMDISFDAFKSKERAVLKASLEFADWERGATITPSTNEIKTKEVYAGEGEGLQMLDNTGALYSPCVSEVTAQLGIGHEWITDIGGTNGKCGASAIPKDAKIELTVYQNSALSKFEDLLQSNTSFPLNIQLGDETGSTVGIYYAEAFVNSYPVASDIGTLQGIKVSIAVSTGNLYRF